MSTYRRWAGRRRPQRAPCRPNPWAPVPVPARRSRLSSGPRPVRRGAGRPAELGLGRCHVRCEPDPDLLGCLGARPPGTGIDAVLDLECGPENDGYRGLPARPSRPRRQRGSRAETRHGHDGTAGLEREVGDAVLDRAQVARPAAALGEHADGLTCPQRRQPAAKGPAIGAPTVDRNLAQPVQRSSDRPVVHLLFDVEDCHPRSHRKDQRAVEKAGVVSRQQDRPLPGHMLGAEHLHAEIAGHQDAPERPGQVHQPLVGPTAGAHQRWARHRRRRRRPSGGRLRKGTHRSAASAIRSRTSFMIVSTASTAVIAVVSISTASSARASGEIGRPLSRASRRARSAAVPRSDASPDLDLNSRFRRSARASGAAVRKTLTVASGTTTVPMSRPSTTIAEASSIAARCTRTSAARTAGTALTALTARVTVAERTSPLTSRPFSRMVGRTGSRPGSTQSPSRTPAIASGSFRSRPSSSAFSVTARYIAPVSRYREPSFWASSRETVDLPAPDGPSTATTNRGRPGPNGAPARAEGALERSDVCGTVDLFSEVGVARKATVGRRCGA